ncbi:response regulator [Pacificimonas sp. WHA3]|uniref:Response regulator n=1 Tax=Pacificimonas pallii TaxID=2827236 RepID=A0ABS6SF45_9SPHN|nr:response regulator [Pacificimonas pallii]MBV7257024.1 response regulator [Pacificimonas pallii]
MSGNYYDQITPLKLLLVDDSIVMRALFSEVFERAEGIRLVGAANGADEARKMIKAFDPDVITLDIEMPKTTGLEFLQELMETDPRPVVMLSARMDDGRAARDKAYELGASACFPKPKGDRAEFARVLADLCRTVTEAHENWAPPESEAAS